MTACSRKPGRRGRGQRAERPAAGPPAAGPAAYPADDCRLGRCLLLRLAPARGRGQQLAGPAVRALDLAAGHHRLLRRDLPGQRGRADRRRARPGSVLAHDPDAGRLVVRQPGLSRQRRRHGAERPVPAKKRRLPRCRRRGGRRQRPDGSRRSPDPAGHLLRPGQPSADAGLQAAAGQQAAADPRHAGRTRRHRAGHPPGQAVRRDPPAARPAVRRRQPADSGGKPGQADPAGRRLRADHPGLHRRPRRLGSRHSAAAPGSRRSARSTWAPRSSPPPRLPPAASEPSRPPWSRA